MKRNHVIMPAILVATFFSPLPVCTAEPDYALHPLTQDAGQQITLTIPMDGKVPLWLVRSQAKTDTLDFQSSPFLDERGNAVNVSIEIPGRTDIKSSAKLSGIRIDQPVFPLRLLAPDLPTPGCYKGQLFLIRQKKVLKTYTLSFTRVRTVSAAKLVLGQQSIDLQSTSDYKGANRAEFIVQIHEESGDWPLEGLFARLEEIKTSTGSFDLKRNLHFQVQDTNIADLWSTSQGSAQSNRHVAPGQQVAVRGEFQHLKAGEYTVKIRFNALNSQAGDRQVLTLNVKARHSYIWAMAVLLAAAAFSYVSTKWLQMRRDRLQLLQRIGKARPGWLSGEPSLLPFVWARAFLKQTEQLCNRPLLAGTETINSRIGQLEQFLKLGGALDRISSLRLCINRMQDIWKPMVFRRAQKCVRRICELLDTHSIEGLTKGDQKICDGIDAKLKELEPWINDNQLASLYWKDLEPDIERLLGEVRTEVFPYKFQTIIKDLIRDLHSKRPVGDLNKMVEKEKSYAALKLLWERQGSPEFDELAQKQEAKHPIEELFEKADSAAWEKLKETEISIVGPEKASPELFETYEPLLFEVKTDDPQTAHNYLFQHVVEYHWEIDVKARNWKGELKSVLKDKITPVTTEPRVVQYAPHSGKLSASVTLHFGKDSHDKVNPCTLNIDNSDAYKLRRAFNRVEFIALALAVALGVVTGLTTFYLNNPTFGSLKDYLSLLLWGAGADQAKNFVQLLGVSTATGGGSAK